MKDLEVQRQALISLKQLADKVNAVESGKIHTLDIGGGLPSELLSDSTRRIWRHSARNFCRFSVPTSH